MSSLISSVFPSSTPIPTPDASSTLPASDDPRYNPTATPSAWTTTIVSTMTVDSTASPQPTQSQRRGPRNSSSLLFGFLVTFLALFIIFMMAGLAWRHWTDRRNRIRRSRMEEIRDQNFRSQIPRIWEVWVRPGNGDWDTIQPLSAGPVPPDGFTETPDDPEAQVTRRPSRRRSRTAPRGIWARIRRPFSVEVPSATDSLSEKRREEENLARINEGGLEVAVLIAMPSADSEKPQIASTSSTPISPETRERDAELGEYALGVAQVRLSRSLD